MPALAIDLSFSKYLHGLKALTLDKGLSIDYFYLVQIQIRIDMDSQTAHEVLTQYLKADGKQRLTPERYAVLDAVLAIQGHFDVESLYYRLLANGVKVSKATVYNTLDVLLSAGLVSKYRFTDKTSRYEKAFGRPHHHHLICLQCGEIIEFVNEKLDNIQEGVCTEKNFKPQSSTLQIFGTCSKCRKKT